MNTGKIFGGLLLVFFGVILFLNNFGIIDWTFWYYLLRFWPALLIIWGLLAITGKSRSPFWVVLLVVIGTFAIGIYSWGNYGYKSDGNIFVSGEENLLIEMGIENADLRLDYGAGRLNIGGNADRILAFAYNDSLSNPKIDYKTKGNRAEYKIKQPSGHFPNVMPNAPPREWDIGLPQGILWGLDLDLGAAKAELDFREVDLKSLDLDMGAGDITIWLGDRGLETKLDIDAGASKIKIIVPENMELKVKIDGGLNSTNLDGLGLVKIGGYYISENISSSSKLILEFDGGVSKFELVRLPWGTTI